MTRRRFLSADDIVALHKQTLERHETPTIINPHALGSAAARPTHYHRGLLKQAAVLLHALIQNHPFLTANKRTAIHATNVFLRLNRVEIWASHNTIYYWLMDALESRSFTPAAIEAWLRGITRRLR